MGKYWRRIVPLFAAWILAACSSPYGQVAGTPLEQVKGSYLSASLGVPVLLGATGSALVVEDGLAVTNAHVPLGLGFLQLRNAAGDGHVAKVLAVSDRLDLALLSVPKGFGTPIRAARTDLAAGEMVWMMGTTIMGAAPVADGRVVYPVGLGQLTWVDPHPGIQRVDVGTRRNVPVVPGFYVIGGGGAGYSGGPMVNGRGEVVGLTVGKLEGWADPNGPKPGKNEAILFAYRIGDVLAEVDRLLGRRMAQADTDPADTVALSAAAAPNP